MELSLASGSLLDSPAGSAPGGELVGLRRVAHGQQRPDGDSKNQDGDDDDHEDFHRILLLDGCSPLGRVCCASASTVPLQFGVLGHIERNGYLPRAGANTPADAGLTRCARLWPRAVRPSRFVRPQPVYPCNRPPRCKRWSRTVGTRTLPRHASLPKVGEVAWSTGLVVSIGSTGAAPAMSTAAGRPAGPAARPGSNGTMCPRWSSAVRDRQRPANDSGRLFVRCCPGCSAQLGPLA
jgi:hypothetical protein